MRQSLTRLIQSVVSTVWPLATKIWDAWGIQLLVLSSFFCQIFLVYFGGRRRYSSHVWIRLLIWVSYLLASNIATVALGKLTVVTIRNPQNPEYDVELQGLLAPLLLMHLGYPDSISAYSIEDTRMGTRHLLNLLIQVGLVIWILIRCFDTSSPISFLFIPLFIAGIIEPAATIFALASVYDDTTSVYELKKIEPMIWKEGKRPNGPCLAFMDPLLMAYYRFDCLRPHRVNWIYHSKFVDNWMSVDKLKPKEAFEVTEIELGFVYDAIYTQSPVVCTKIGLVSRMISIICLVSTLCGFSIIFRSAFLLDGYVAYTYAMLLGSAIMELYQFITLPFSYMAVIALQKWVKNERILKFMVKQCKNQKMWSNSLMQLNLIKYCFIKDICIPKQVSFILKMLHRELEEKIKKYWRATRGIRHVPVDLFLKEKIIETMRKLEEERQTKNMPFEDRGFWTTVDDFEDQTTTTTDNNAIINTAIKKSCMNKELDKCIIIWHIATDLLLQRFSDPDSSPSIIYYNPSPYQEMSELLSNYMMYLLMDRPYMLSLTTSDITLGYASSTLKALVDQTPGSFDESSRKAILRTMMDHQVTVCVNDKYKTFITRDWDVLDDVKQLVTELEKLNEDSDKWELISRVWIQLLCYAASKSHAYHHMRMLRRGGELITHVWLLLLHKTDKLATSYSQTKHN